MCKRFIIPLVIPSLFLSMTVGAWAQGSGVIQGQALNGSSDGSPLEGVPVTVWVLRGEEEEGSLQETTDEQGRFRFQDLATGGYTYQVEVGYQGVRYGSDVVAFPEKENALSIPLTVYEATTSDADLRIERAHLILDFQPGVILVQEIQIFVNGGNTSYIGSMGEEGGATLHFPLPRGVSGLQLVEGFMSCCVLKTETGFASDRPIFPGVKQFVFTYELRHQFPSYTLLKGIAYPINSLDVLVVDVGAEVSAPELIVQETLSLEGGRYLHLSAENLTPADDLTLQFANLSLEGPEATPTAASTTGPGLLGFAIMGSATLAVLLALGYPFLKKGRTEKD